MSATAIKAQPQPELTVRIKRMEHGKGLDLPRYETALAAGCDVRAAVTEPVTLKPGERDMVPTGIAIAMPPGWEAQMRPRSGLAAKHGIHILAASLPVHAGELGGLAVNRARLIGPEGGIGVQEVAPIAAPRSAKSWQPKPKLTLQR